MYSVKRSSLRAFASMPSTAIFLRARAEIKNLLYELASKAKIWGARASEHSFRAVKNFNGPFITPKCSSLNTFGMGRNNNNIDHHTQSVTVDTEKDVDAMYRKIQHRVPSCYSLRKQPDIS